MTTLQTNFESLQVSGITDILQIQIKPEETIQHIPTMKTVIDTKGNFVNINSSDHNVNCCYVSPNLNILNISDSKGNILN
jgi:hypothetical protein